MQCWGFQSASLRTEPHASPALPLLAVYNSHKWCMGAGPSPLVIMDKLTIFLFLLWSLANYSNWRLANLNGNNKSHFPFCSVFITEEATHSNTLQVSQCGHPGLPDSQAVTFIGHQHMQATALGTLEIITKVLKILKKLYQQDLLEPTTVINSGINWWLYKGDLCKAK